MEQALFGVLFTLTKEKEEESWKFAWFEVLVHFIQLFIIGKTFRDPPITIRPASSRLPPGPQYCLTLIPSCPQYLPNTTNGTSRVIPG